LGGAFQDTQGHLTGDRTGQIKIKIRKLKLKTVVVAEVVKTELRQKGTGSETQGRVRVSMPV